MTEQGKGPDYPPKSAMQIALDEAREKAEKEGREWKAAPAAPAEEEQPAAYDEEALTAEAHALLKGKGLTIDEEEPTNVPSELREIYGDKKVPEEALAMYKKLKGAEKRKSYVEKLRADKEEADRKQAAKDARRAEREAQKAAKAPAAESGAVKTVPPELAAIFGDKVPRRVLKMYGSLTDPRTKEAVIAQLTADKEKKEKKKKKEPETVVASAAPPPEVPQETAVPDAAPVALGADVDTKKKRVPQYFAGRSGMQEDMDKLNREAAAPPKPKQEESGAPADAPPGPEERTPEEEHKALNDLLEKMEKISRRESDERAARAPRTEAPPSFSERSEGLRQRSAALDAEAKKLGWVERSFRSLGEKYNKLSFIKKLGLGVALGLGAAVFSAVSIPTALLFTGGLAAQRAAGMAGMFLKIEKQLQEKAGGIPVSKERAMLGAVAYTAVMGYAIREAVEYLGETEFVHTIQDWLKTHYPFGSAETPVQPRAVQDHPAQKIAVAPAVVESPAAPEVEPPAPVEAPLVYETVVTPEPIQTIEAPEYHNMVPVSPEAPAVQPEQISAPLEQVSAPSEQISAPLEQGQGYLVDSDNNPVLDSQGEPIRTGSFEAPAPAEVPAAPPTEASAPAEAPLTQETAVTPEPVQTAETSGYQNTTASSHAEGTSEAAAPSPETGVDFRPNAAGLLVDIAHANSYLDAQGNHIIFGGSLEDRAQKALELVARDHSAVVYFDSTRPGGLFNLFPQHHLSKAYWFEGSGNVQTAAGPGETIEVQQPVIVDDTIDETLRGRRLPTIDDLKELYKPGGAKP